MEKANRNREARTNTSFFLFTSFNFFFLLLGLDVGILRIASLVPDKEMKIRAQKAKEKRKTEKGDFFGRVLWDFDFFFRFWY